MQLKFKRIKFDDIFGASFNDCTVAGDVVGGAEMDDEALSELSCDILQGKFYIGGKGPIDESTFIENLSFKNPKGLFESENPINLAYSSLRLTIDSMPINFLENSEEDIIRSIKERIEKAESFIAKLIKDEEFDFEV